MQWLPADQGRLKDKEEVAGKVVKVVAAADKIVTDDPDVTESRKIVDFLLAQKRIKKSTELGTALPKGWDERHGT